MVRLSLLASLAVAACAARPTPASIAISRAPAAAVPARAAPACAPPQLWTRAAGCVRLRGLGLGEAHACALTDDGRVLCWGANSAGQLGDGTDSQRSAPRLVAGVDDAVELHALAQRTCARGRSGRIQCWGSNYFGESDANRRLSPSPPGRRRAATDETDPDFMLQNVRFVPALVDLPGPATSFTMGYQHGCALLEDGRVACWGRSEAGSLGGGAAGGFRQWVFVPPARFVELAAGGYHTCGRTAGGELYCWGSNSLGQLGDADASSELRKLSEPTAVTALVARGSRTCAVLPNGELTCFGEGAECAGDGKRHSPEVDVTIGRVRGFSLGGCHYCAWRAGGAVDCWDTFEKPVGAPPERLAIPPAESVDSGSDFSCALLAEGSVVCWGVNYNGELGSPEGMMASGLGKYPPRAVDWAAE